MKTRSKTKRVQHFRHPFRRAAVTVEAAIMLPVLVVISLGSIDIAQYINVAQTVNNASREGARIASRDDTTTVAEVKSAVRAYIRDAFPNERTAEINRAILVHVTDESGGNIPYGDLNNIESGNPVSVRVVLDFAKVRWIKGVDYWNGEINESTSVGRRE